MNPKIEDNIVIDETINEPLSNFLLSKLKAYNESKVGPYHRQHYNLYYKSTDDQIVAGIGGDILGKLCNIYVLWVDESIRNQGVGTKLIQELVKYAKSKNCQIIQLDTAEFQAKAFYEKCGFVTVAVLPEGFMEYDHYIMRKIP